MLQQRVHLPQPYNDGTNFVKLVSPSFVATGEEKSDGQYTISIMHYLAYSGPSAIGTEVGVYVQSTRASASKVMRKTPELH